MISLLRPPRNTLVYDCINTAPGWFLIGKNDPGLWFVFHHEAEGTLAVDLTTAHPDIPYRGFESVLKAEDIKSDAEKIVLLGGPQRPDDALIVLHETKAATEDSNIVDDAFSFLSYNYVLIPGKPPAIQTPDNKPSRIELPARAHFLIIMGYRIWNGATLKAEMNAGHWTCIPATPDIVFRTARKERRARVLNLIN